MNWSSANLANDFFQNGVLLDLWVWREVRRNVSNYEVKRFIYPDILWQPPPEIKSSRTVYASSRCTVSFMVLKVIVQDFIRCLVHLIRNVLRDMKIIPVYILTVQKHPPYEQHTYNFLASILVIRLPFARGLGAQVFGVL